MMSKFLVVALCAYLVVSEQVAPLVEDPYGGGGGGGKMGGGGGGKMGGGGGGMMGGGKMGGGGGGKMGGGGGGNMGGGKMGGGGGKMGGGGNTMPKAPHASTGHSTGGKAKIGTGTGTGVHAPPAPKPVQSEAPISAPVPGGWPLPTEPTESLRIPLPVNVEDPYGGGGGGGKMGGGGGGKMGGGGNMGGGKMGGGGNMGGGKMGGGGNMGGGKTGGGGNMGGGGTPTPTPKPTGGSCASFADANYLCSTAACTSKVSVGAAQPNYQCAEFVARTLASTGKIAGLTPSSPQSAYGSYSFQGKTYDLLWTTHRVGGPLGLEDYLLAAGWKAGGAVQDCSVVFVNGASGAWGHVAVGVGPNLLDAHNNARLHVATTYYTVNAVYNK